MVCFIWLGYELELLDICEHRKKKGCVQLFGKQPVH